VGWVTPFAATSRLRLVAGASLSVVVVGEGASGNIAAFELAVALVRSSSSFLSGTVVLGGFVDLGRTSTAFSIRISCV
jgi:hypothetical protein